MNCKAYREMLHSFADNELNEIEKSIVSEHVENCAACRDELVEIKRLKHMLTSLRFHDAQLGGIKESIMATIRETKKKVPAYDIKVLTRLGASMIACGLIALVLNFTGLGEGLNRYALPISQAYDSTIKKIDQPIAFINKGMTNMSEFIFGTNGMMFEIEQKIKGGM